MIPMKNLLQKIFLENRLSGLFLAASRGRAGPRRKTMSKSTMLNGVDRQKLFGTIEAIKADTSLAQFQFRLRNE